MTPLRIAYADPPYLGKCGMYDHHHEAPYGCWDEAETHIALAADLQRDFPDGWALSCSTPSLRLLLPACPEARIGAWVKGWCSWKPNTYPAYAWEPVLFGGGRKPATGDKTWMTARDWMQANVTTGQPVKGAKPEAFCMWVFALLGAHPEDELVDLFSGSGAVTRAWAKFCQQLDFTGVA